MKDSPTKKELLMKLLKGIETGDAASAAVVNEEKYVQHNPQTHEGSEGLAELFKRIAKTNPKVTFVRVFEDGDYAFAHNEYDFASVRIAFEVFRFENDKAVEHWDNIQPVNGPNPSGREMLDGETKIVDLDKTERNRSLAEAFISEVCIKEQFDQLTKYISDDLIQHDPVLADGSDALLRSLQDPDLKYIKLHKTLAEGNFVLCLCEGYHKNVHTSFYNLFRLQEDKIVEHWNTIETIAPRSEWKNDNGKF